MAAKLLCAWISRHEPTAAVRAALADYDIVITHPKGRFLCRQDVYNTTAVTLGRRPDLIVMVLPVAWTLSFLQTVDRCWPGVPVVRQVMRQPELREWTGLFQEFTLTRHKSNFFLRPWVAKVTVRR